jgi:alpha,alpha-trehalose phosphorylase
MRDHDGALSFTPLPEGLTRLYFGLCFRDRWLKVEVKHHQARYSLLAGPPL